MNSLTLDRLASIVEEYVRVYSIDGVFSGELHYLRWLDNYNNGNIYESYINKEGVD